MEVGGGSGHRTASRPPRNEGPKGHQNGLKWHGPAGDEPVTRRGRGV